MMQAPVDRLVESSVKGAQRQDNLGFGDIRSSGPPSIEDDGSGPALSADDNEPVLVASRAAVSRGSYLGLKATVKALSMMRPPICVPKSAADASQSRASRPVLTATHLTPLAAAQITNCK